MTQISFHYRNVVQIASQDESAPVKASENRTFESIILRTKTTPGSHSNENKLLETKDNSNLKCGSRINFKRPPQKQRNMRQYYKK